MSQQNEPRRSSASYRVNRSSSRRSNSELSATSRSKRTRIALVALLATCSLSSSLLASCAGTQAPIDWAALEAEEWAMNEEQAVGEQ